MACNPDDIGKGALTVNLGEGTLTVNLGEGCLKVDFSDLDLFLLISDDTGLIIGDNTDLYITSDG